MSGWTAFCSFVGLIALITGVALGLGEGGTAEPGKGGGSLFSGGMTGHEVGGGGGVNAPSSDSGLAWSGT